MEHIRQFDWCYSQPDVYFLKENDLTHSVTERILRNKFHDPLISSDSDDEKPNINWDEVFSKKNNFERHQRIFVPCLHQVPQYLKLSALTNQQQYQCLKVLCSQNPHILEQEFIPRPTKTDYRVFEELKDLYEKEQKEYIEWAKTLWTNVHCIRALRPKPPIETVYEARFKMRANEMQSYPKHFDMAAQIPLESRHGEFDMVPDKDLVKVDVKELPLVEFRPITSRFTIIKACSVPEPCNKHPCRFILPTENNVSILPFTEVQRELAQFALDSGAQYVASENALKCLVEQDRSWDIPVTVSPIIGPDGETTNVVVLGSEFAINRESVLMRTYRALRHLLENSLIPAAEKKKMQKISIIEDKEQDISKINFFADDADDSSDDEHNSLCIDEDSQDMACSEKEVAQSNQGESEKENENKLESEQSKEKTVKSPRKRKSSSADTSKGDDIDNDKFYSCTCKDTMFEWPPPRSYTKWKVRNKHADDTLNVIVHCSHKVRHTDVLPAWGPIWKSTVHADEKQIAHNSLAFEDKNGEVVLEPIPEYQLDLGASAQSKEKIRSLALSLHLRKNATLMNIRIDGASGEVATFEGVNQEEFKQKHGDVIGDVTNIAHTALGQLQGLRPGQYVLRHEPSHGANALLYVAKSDSHAALSLQFDCTQLAEADEAKDLKVAPTLTTVLLPYHKFRRMLPCAFTAYEKQVAREIRKPPAKQKTPPQALQWPKRKRKKGKK